MFVEWGAANSGFVLNHPAEPRKTHHQSPARDATPGRVPGAVLLGSRTWSSPVPQSHRPQARPSHRTPRSSLASVAAQCTRAPTRRRPWAPTPTPPPSCTRRRWERAVSASRKMTRILSTPRHQRAKRSWEQRQAMLSKTNTKGGKWIVQSSIEYLKIQCCRHHCQPFISVKIIHNAEITHISRLFQISFPVTKVVKTTPRRNSSSLMWYWTDTLANCSQPTESKTWPSSQQIWRNIHSWRGLKKERWVIQTELFLCGQLVHKKVLTTTVGK